MTSKLIFALLMAVQAVSPWKQATAGYTFAFPRDHASHPDYKIEWWFYTGNVKAGDGRRFGYQITFFRVATALAGAELVRRRAAGPRRPDHR